MNVEQAKTELTNFINSYANDEITEFTTIHHKMTQRLIGVKLLFIQKEQTLETLEDYMAEARDEEGSEALELVDEINNFIEYFTTFDELRDKMFAYANNYCSKK